MAPEPVKLLIVDDEPRNLDALEVMLASSGCTFIRASSPDDALLAMLQHDFAAMVLQFAERVGPVFASTAQDLARGKPTEIDALNGFVVRRGAGLGVPTPVNQAIVALVKLLEARR